MELSCDKFKIIIDDISGCPVNITSLEDEYGMNWIRSDYPWGRVDGFENLTTEKIANGVFVTGINNEHNLRLTINRFISNEKYFEEYIFENISDRTTVISPENIGIVFPYNCLFDKKENMIHTRCNSHIWCAEDICNIHSVKLDGKKPYFIQKAIKGSFSGYGLLCDISAAPNGSWDRGNIVLYPKETVLQKGEKTTFAFEFYFSDKREEISPVSADKYSGFLNDKFEISVNWSEKIETASATIGDKNIPLEIKENSAAGTLSFDSLGEKRVNLKINDKSTFININILKPLEEILAKRVEFITEKQQFLKGNKRLDGAYLIYDKETDSQYYDAVFTDHNCARERLAMGALVALSLSKKYNKKTEESLKKHREFIEREILDIKTGFVNNGIEDKTFRLYNFPWVSTYYLEWYIFSKDVECLLTASRILHKYYELGGNNQESPCIEAYEILLHLKEEGLNEEYEKLRQEFISHGDSIYSRRTKSTSQEVSCANGMMNLMCTFLFQVYLITEDKKYLEPLDDLLKISESFYDLQPDYRMYGIALRYWDMYWFGKKESYGDTYPQWLSALTAQLYYYCDKATGADNSRLIRENLLGNCCVNSSDGFAACGYLYPKKVKVFSSDPKCTNINRPLGEWIGERFDEFANDQDWALYYAAKYLL